MEIPEIWRPIKDYEGIYEISNCGSVKSLARGTKGKNGGVSKEKILKCSSSTGYKLATLRNITGDTKYAFVHRLVSEAFIPNPDNKPCVNHKNGIKTDNHVSNLEWVTYKENTIAAHKTGLCHPPKGELNSHAKLTKEQILEIMEWSKTITQKDLADKYRVSRENIGKIINRKTWRHLTKNPT